MAKTDHAGLSNGELNLVLFENEDQLKGLLGKLGIEVRDNFVVSADGKAEHCQSCAKTIRVDNLGNIMPGSTLFFCDDPYCLSTYVAEHLAEDGAGAKA